MRRKKVERKHSGKRHYLTLLFETLQWCQPHSISLHSWVWDTGIFMGRLLYACVCSLVYHQSPLLATAHIVSTVPFPKLFPGKLLLILQDSDQGPASLTSYVDLIMFPFKNLLYLVAQAILALVTLQCIYLFSYQTCVQNPTLLLDLWNHQLLRGILQWIVVIVISTNINNLLLVSKPLLHSPVDYRGLDFFHYRPE